jgi:hypothetical protein
MVMTWPEKSSVSEDRGHTTCNLPLTQHPSSEARNATTRATSSGVAQRLRGQCSAMRFSIFSAGHSGVPPGM